MITRYHLENIRTLLIEGFMDEDLRHLCYDITDFRPVYDQLTPNSSKAEIVDLLLEHADRRLQLDTLLALAKERNPARYAKHRPYYSVTFHSVYEKTERTQSSRFGAAGEFIEGVISTIIGPILAWVKLVTDFKQTTNEIKESLIETLSENVQSGGTRVSSQVKRKGVFKEARIQFSLLKNGLDKFLHFESETKIESGFQQWSTVVTSKGETDSNIQIQGPGGTRISATTHPKADVEPPPPRLPDIELPSPRPSDVSPPPTIKPRNTPAEPPPYFTRHKATSFGSESIVSKTKNVNSWVTIIFVVATIYAMLEFGLANAIVSIVISLIVYTLVTTGIDSGFSSLKSKMGKLGNVLDYLAIICGVCAGLFIFSQMLTTKTGQSITKWMAGEAIQLLNWLLKSF